MTTLQETRYQLNVSGGHP